MNYGVSFSIKYCQELDIDWVDTLTAALSELGFKRVRLMSYWDTIEPEQGTYSFADLDRQFALCRQYGASVTLCLGMRQPRYPECHIPTWAKGLPPDQFSDALLRFNAAVIKRYASEPLLVSWQLENEAFNRGIGTCTDYSRKRLKAEFKQLKTLDPHHPIIMSTSNSWGIPLLGPIPDIVGFSIYRNQYRYKQQRYSFSRLPPWFYTARAKIIQLILRRPVIIHELQCEPWGPRATHDLSDEEQAHSMDASKLQSVLAYAQKTNIKHVDLWGLEWWYWRRIYKNDDSLLKLIQTTDLEESTA